MTIVDPMRPLKPRKPLHPVSMPNARAVPHSKPQVVSSIAISPPPAAPEKRASTKPLVKQRRVKTVKASRHWLKIVAVVLFVISLMVLPEFISQVVLVAYGILAVFRRYVVGLTFGLAVLVLLLSPLFGVITGSSGNGAILASYSFGLLLVGFIQLIIEYRRMQRM